MDRVGLEGHQERETQSWSTERIADMYMPRDRDRQPGIGGKKGRQKL